MICTLNKIYSCSEAKAYTPKSRANWRSGSGCNANLCHAIEYSWKADILSLMVVQSDLKYLILELRYSQNKLRFYYFCKSPHLAAAAPPPAPPAAATGLLREQCCIYIYI